MAKRADSRVAHALIQAQRLLMEARVFLRALNDRSDMISQNGKPRCSEAQTYYERAEELIRQIDEQFS